MNETNRPYPPRRRRRRRRRINPTAIIFWLSVVLVVLSIVALLTRCSAPEPQPNSTEPFGSLQSTAPTVSTAEGTQPGTDPTEPSGEAPVQLLGSATVAATGDILMHMPCVRPGAVGDGTYDFGPYFTHLAPYVQDADYALANLETTLAGLNGGYEYSGYPNFNCPDGIVTSAQSAGFDMLLTANNHTYDTQTLGFFRTQQVLREQGMDYLGTKASVEDSDFLIKEIDGIQIGMICYTYETNADPNYVALNGGANMKQEEKDLINTFMKDDVATFTKDLGQDIQDMKAEGAEAIVLYIHWGEEYQLTQNSQQEAMAQAACNLGVDVIVGGHPHVIQPMDLLTSQTNPEHKTVCLYSTGNLISNQRLGNISSVKTAHTEDGILFRFSFNKYSDGTVRVEQVEALPLWVDMYTSPSTGKVVYDILPLDRSVTDWTSALNLRSGSLQRAEDSYDRTMAIIGPGLAKIQSYLETLPEIS